MRFMARPMASGVHDGYRRQPGNPVVDRDDSLTFSCAAAARRSHQPQGHTWALDGGLHPHHYGIVIEHGLAIADRAANRIGRPLVGNDT
jgi:hypothetical protein